MEDSLWKDILPEIAKYPWDSLVETTLLESLRKKLSKIHQNKSANIL